jgi:hypothetical protein
MKHPFLHIIEAIAEGKEVQFINKSLGNVGFWRDLSDVVSNAARADLHVYLVKAAEHLEWRVKPVTVTGWVNVYPCGELSVEIHASKSEADEYATDRRIACIEITYTEGQGLDT